MISLHRPLIAALVTLSALASVPIAAAQTPSITPQERARFERIVRRTPLIDGHNDLPYAIRGDHAGNLAEVDLNTDTRALTPPMQTDIARLRAGGMGAQFWSVYVPATLKGLDSTRMAFEQIDLTGRVMAAYPCVFGYAESGEDFVRIHRAGCNASMFGMEGGEAIDNNLALLRELRQAGVLYMTLTHSTTIDWVDSATDAPKHGGLTPFGVEVVREMGRVGMLVDLSHVSAEAMNDALDVAVAPVIFSHSSAFGVNAH